MQNLIDICNHILSHPDVYYEGHDPSLDVQEEALNLCLRHGERFCITFVRNYLQVHSEEVDDRL